MGTGHDAILQTYHVSGKPLYLVGCFDTGVTVYSQQVRALNLVYSMVEDEIFASGISGYGTGELKRVAIVGAGFAGLTAAAALLRKWAHVSITLFEQRDALLPLQHGSDTRWLHPHIYDWPNEGSDTNAAMLPVLNWVAARASDVVVQVLAAWSDIVSGADDVRLTLYCNCRHLQVSEPVAAGGLEIEWVGERRNKVNGTIDNSFSGPALGQKSVFDTVILTTGFGLERESTLSYWRNDIVGQPSLDRPKQLYVVSGQGDGAAIDLLRIRISQYRQDRVLSEIFHDCDNLLRELRVLSGIYGKSSRAGLYRKLEDLEANIPTEFDRAKHVLSNRLRRDTDAVLRMKVRRFSEIFDPANARLSFQNKVLIYLLFRCGGFTPSSMTDEALTKHHEAENIRVIKRHGTLRNDLLQELLDPSLFKSVCTQRKADLNQLSQVDTIAWPGGYFGVPGSMREISALQDNQRERWRKEYLPGSVTIVATAFVSCIAGYLKMIHPPTHRLRITFHRAVMFGQEESLQQCSEYLGVNNDNTGGDSLGRAFPVTSATIGLAYRTRKIVRSTRNATPETLHSAMELLQLNAGSRSMQKNVTFLLAIPLLEPETNFIAPTPVVGTLYIDSTCEGFFLEKEQLSAVVAMTAEFIDSLATMPARALDRIRNVPLAPTVHTRVNPQLIGKEFENALELLETPLPPQTSQPFQINFDYSDFIPVGSAPTGV